VRDNPNWFADLVSECRKVFAQLTSQSNVPVSTKL